MLKKKKKTFIEGVTGLGGSLIDSKYLKQHDYGTFYGGLQVTEAIKNEIEEQPISDFIYFEPIKKSFVTKYKMPEMGRGKGPDGIETDYKIREYYNRCIKYFANDMFNENGDVKYEEYDLQYVYPVSVQAKLMSSNRQKVENFADELGIPKEEVEQFSAFLKNNSGIVGMAVNQIGRRLDMLGRYEDTLRNLSQLQDKDNPQKNKVLQQYLNENTMDYVNTRNQLNELFNMDPVTEKRDLSFPSCDDSSGSMVMLVGQCNNYRRAHNKTPIEGADKISFSFDRNKGLLKDDSCMLKFSKHDVFYAPVMINNKECLLSMETTAAPRNRSFYHPDEEFHGFGVYQDLETLKKTYNDPLQQVQQFKDIQTKKDYISLVDGEAFLPGNVKPEMNVLRFNKNNATKYYATDIAIAGNTVSKKTLPDILADLNKVDGRTVWSSSKFKQMRTDLEALKQIKSLDDFDSKLEKLIKSTKDYIMYKHPNGDPKKEQKMSDVANSRLDFAKEVFSFANTTRAQVLQVIKDDKLAQKTDNIIKKTNEQHKKTVESISTTTNSRHVKSATGVSVR